MLSTAARSAASTSKRPLLSAGSSTQRLMSSTPLGGAVDRSGRVARAPPARSLSTTPTTRAGGSGVIKATIALSLIGITSYIAGSLYPPEVLKMLYKPVTIPRLKGDGPEAEQNARTVEDALHSLDLVKKLKKLSVAQGSAAELEVLRSQGKSITDLDPSTTVAVPASSAGNIASTGPPLEGGAADTHLYVMTRPYLKFSKEKAQHNLTAGSLRGPGMVAIPPLVFAKTALGASKLGGTEGDGTIVLHLGRSVCGHDGIVHGGMLATVCDEALARTAMYNLPGKIGVTARLEIDYRKPTKADQFIVLDTELVEQKGRKAVVKGSVRDANGQLLLECRAIFVEPKYAKYFLDAKAIKQAIEG